jgi:uncharacterized protein (TIGR02246 family)
MQATTILAGNQMRHEHNPADVYPTLMKAFNAGDLDGILACYEPEACYVPKSGRAARGPVELRELFRAILARRTQIKLDVRKITPSGGDLALVIVDWTEWTSNTASSAGEAKQWASTATDIVRKQPDDTWKLALDIPYGIE